MCGACSRSWWGLHLLRRGILLLTIRPPPVAFVIHLSFAARRPQVSRLSLPSSCDDEGLIRVRGERSPAIMPPDVLPRLLNSWQHPRRSDSVLESSNGAEPVSVRL